MLHIYHTSFYGLHGKGPLIAAHSTILLFLSFPPARSSINGFSSRLSPGSSGEGGTVWRHILFWATDRGVQFHGATVPLLMLSLLTLPQLSLLESLCLRTHQFFLHFFTGLCDADDSRPMLILTSLSSRIISETRWWFFQPLKHGDSILSDWVSLLCGTSKTR